MKKFKRAFTIVELVIVIAVIAILAAVLIPTFSSIIRKANVSNDTQLVRNMNTALVVDSTINGKHKTMQSALDAAFDAGYDLAKINARANQNEILWDSKNDVFCYLNVEDEVARIEYIPNSIEANAELPATSYLLWRVVRGTEEINPSEGYLQNFSVYLASDYAGSSSVSITGKGFDAGNSTVVTSVSYSGASDARNVVIRTNSFDTKLTIDAASDTVKHYGKVGSLNIIAVANASYHENGQVKFAEIAKGRIALEAGSEVNHIHINAKETVQEGQNAFEEIIISKATTVEMPDFSRDDVEIPSQGTRVVALQTGTEEITSSTELDYVWLTKQGVYEQITVSESKTSAGSTWVNTSDKPAETKTAAQQIANNIGENVTIGEKEYAITVTNDNNRDLILAEVDAQGEIIVNEQGQIAGQTYEVEINSQGQTVIDTGAAEKTVIEVVEAQPDKTTVETGATLFAGGTGTESDPYLVSNKQEFENMSKVNNYSYYKWAGNSVADASNWSNSNTLVGSFDGNGVTFNNLDSVLIRNVLNGSESENPAEDKVNVYTIKNLTINANIVTDGWIAGVVRTAGVHNFVMENVNVHGYIEGSTGVASFICFGAGNCHPSYEYDGHITFKNCNSDAIIYAKSGNAVGFIAHAMMGSSAGTVTLDNSNYTGSTSATSSSGCKYICGNWFNGTVTDDQSAAKNNVIYKTSDNGWTYKASGKTGTFTVKNGTLPSHIGDSFELVAESGATRAVISLVISPDPGCMTSTYMTEEVLVSNGMVVSDNIKYFTIRVNRSGISESGVHGNNYDVLNSAFNGKLGGNTIVRITQYNAAGGIISITNYNFGDSN